ncbi:hypothetical protein CDL15_Pgr001251 [Punica granatum]|uniref:Uncharacterized protein n=1 Tax=Punica granatum TaxID=22663 RepID=A0A218WJX6_PUNGR|nr:hypothetical protein CDL15_Pgr001251 [Punica granatum]
MAPEKEREGRSREGEGSRWKSEWQWNESRKGLVAAGRTRGQGTRTMENRLFSTEKGRGESLRSVWDR